MTCMECMQYIDSLISTYDFDEFDDCGFQFNVLGKEGGMFYLAIEDHKAILEEKPHEYNVRYNFTPAVLSKILDGKLDPIYAFTTGKFTMVGDIVLGRKLLISIGGADK